MYKKIRNSVVESFWDIINPDESKLVTVTNETSANNLLEKLNKEYNNGSN